MPIRRRVAARDVTARQTLAKVDPAAPHRQAILASRAGTLHLMNLYDAGVITRRFDEYIFELGHG
jgi:hypothetical protein